jgi:hypothetical protein
MKEVYFAEILEKNGDSRAAGGGRTELIKASLTPIHTLYQFCPELADLRERIRQIIHTDVP